MPDISIAERTRKIPGCLRHRNCPSSEPQSMNSPWLLTRGYTADISVKARRRSPYNRTNASAVALS